LCKWAQARPDRPYNDSFISIGPGMYATRNPVQKKYSWCCKEVCTNTTNIFIKHGTVSTMDGSAPFSDLGVFTCPLLMNGSCILSDKLYVWNHTVINANLCPFVFKGQYTAEYTNNHCLVGELQIALSFEKKIVYDNMLSLPRCLPFGVTMSDQGYVAHRMTKDHRFYDPRNPEHVVNTTFKLRDNDPVNGKENYNSCMT
jgi:hypothetical protein